MFAVRPCEELAQLQEVKLRKVWRKKFPELADTYIRTTKIETQREKLKTSEKLPDDWIDLQILSLRFVNTEPPATLPSQFRFLTQTPLSKGFRPVEVSSVFLCLPVGLSNLRGCGLSYDFMFLMYLRRTVLFLFFSICSAFSLLGWSDNFQASSMTDWILDYCFCFSVFYCSLQSFQVICVQQTFLNLLIIV